MPEPLIGESITDLDRSEAGELELDVTTTVHRTTSPTLNALTASVEAEYGLTDRLGLALEVGLSKGFGPDSAAAPFEPAVTAGAAWALLHDFARDIHLQLESRVFLVRETRSDLIEFEDSNLPVTLDLRFGARGELGTVRAGLGVGFGAHSRREIPIRGNIAVFTELRPAAPIGFVGLEVDGDWARAAPVLLVPTAVFGSHPIRLGLAIPTAISNVGPVPGVMLRVIYEPD